MSRIFSIGLDVLAASTIVLPMLIVWQKKRQREISFARKFMIVIFTLYVAAIFSAVGIPNVSYIRVNLSWNLIPIVPMVNDFTEPVLNVILFVPLGCMLPILWSRFQSVKNTVITGFSLSLFIELVQIFSYRATDVNDLITNTTGTAIGYLIWKCFGRKLAEKLIAEESEKDTRQLECICGIVFLVMFFLSYFISNALWNIIL